MAGGDAVVPELDGEEIPSVFCLEFVNMNASSAAEKQRNQTVIRSTAMKNFRRRQKSQRIRQSTGLDNVNGERGANLVSGQQRSKKCPDNQPGVREGDEDQYQQCTENSSQKTLVASSQAVDDWIFQTTSGDSWLGNRRASSSTTSSDRVSNWDDSTAKGHVIPVYRTSNGLFARHSPVDILGGGRVDPFRTYPVSYVGPEAHALIDHSTSSLWPGLRPREGNQGHNNISSAWLEKVTSRPLVMHALLFGGAVHMDVLRSPRINLNNPVRLFHKVQTMRLLKEELKHTELSDLDDLILAVLCLGANEVETMMDNLKPKTRSPFNSPLTSSQWLDVYGSMSHIKAHTLAMRSLVDRQGGLKNIQLEGLAEVIEFSDILGATQTLSKPYWQLLERTAKASMGSYRGLESAYYPLQRLGQGFSALKLFGISDDAENVLQGLADLTIVIERYCRGIAPVPQFSHIIARRNYVQHALLSLPTADELEFEEVGSSHLYETIRYAALIYSVGVTFPLPTITGIFDILTTRLKSILEASQLDTCWRLYPQMLLWVLTLGGIAASITEHRRWYVHMLAMVSAALNISNWENVVEEMGQYLWLERVCDAGGRNLWQEVFQDRFMDMEFVEDGIGL